MRFARGLVAAGFVFLGVHSDAEAQEFCRKLVGYLADPPKAFIAERGQLMRPGHWRSNTKTPNASCYIAETSDHEHTASCVANNEGSLDTIVEYGKQVEQEIDGCLQKIATGSLFKKRVKDTNKNGTISHAIYWTNNSSSANFEIYLSGDRDDDGSLSNYFSVTWQKK